MIGIFEFNFMGGSLGSVVGEKITRLIERGLKKNRCRHLLCFRGARMQEGILSLMQMAKTSAALARLHEARIPYICVLTDPTTGGVSASIGMLGDVIIAEPKAMIGFAGPRVIKDTIRAELPEGFQRAEFLLEHGMVDLIVERKDLRHTLASLLEMLKMGIKRNSSSMGQDAYQQSLDYLYGLEKFGMIFGLNQAERILRAIGDPHERSRPSILEGQTEKGLRPR